MLLRQMLDVGLRSIRAAPFRSVLTMLGIVIGIASVIVVIGLSAGARRAIDSQLESLGTDMVAVKPDNRFNRGVSVYSGTISLRDAESILGGTGSVVAVVPEVAMRLSVRFDGVNHSMPVFGTSPDFRTVNGYELDHGTFLDRSDVDLRKRTAVLGAGFAAKFRTPPEALVGNTIYIVGEPYQVTGIFAPIGSVGWRNFDDYIWVPVTTAQSRVTGSQDLDVIYAKLAPGVSVETGIVDIEQVMRREHRIPPGTDNDFTIGDPAQMLEIRKATNEVLSYLLLSIAGVSLLVGGIGTMNIMLVTVAERVREIGVRKSVGATRANILLQFLVESVTLCLLGGIGGVFVGALASGAVRGLLGWEALVSPVAILVAVAFSAAVGLVAGTWPAIKASRLSPVDALRFE
jgi:putative ABC transport system permease protein